MRSFILTFDDGRKRGYTTLAALFEDNTKEELGVSKFTLDRFDFYLMNYENSKCTIEVLDIKTRGDIIREKEKFL